MAKYHISRNGTPELCKAEKRACPLGGADEHFNTYGAAERGADAINEKRYGHSMGGKLGPGSANKFNQRGKGGKGKKGQGKPRNAKKEHYKNKDIAAKNKMTPEQIAAKAKNNPNMINRVNGEPNNYRGRIKKSERYNKKIKKDKEGTGHASQRDERTQLMEATIGIGKPVDQFLVDDGRERPTVMEIHDNGVIKVYDYRSHKLITTLPPKANRVIGIYERARIDVTMDQVNLWTKNQEACKMAGFEHAREHGLRKAIL